jgi:hypothetical protein
VPVARRQRDTPDKTDTDIVSCQLVGQMLLVGIE